MNFVQFCFFRLLNPDWSFQISGATAICKEFNNKKKRGCLTIGGTNWALPL